MKAFICLVLIIGCNFYIQSILSKEEKDTEPAAKQHFKA